MKPDENPDLRIKLRVAFVKDVPAAPPIDGKTVEGGGGESKADGLPIFLSADKDAAVGDDKDKGAGCVPFPWIPSLLPPAQVLSCYQWLHPQQIG